jgi:hypothetical protein
VPTLYDDLGVSPHASSQELKAAYRRLAYAHHPDRNHDSPASAERFKRISAAYAVLADPLQRRDYDDELHAVRADAPRRRETSSKPHGAQAAAEVREAERRAAQEAAAQRARREAAEREAARRVEEELATRKRGAVQRLLYPGRHEVLPTDPTDAWECLESLARRLTVLAFGLWFVWLVIDQGAEVFGLALMALLLFKVTAFVIALGVLTMQTALTICLGLWALLWQAGRGLWARAKARS